MILLTSELQKGLEEISVSDLAEYDVLSVAASLDKRALRS